MQMTEFDNSQKTQEGLVSIIVPVYNSETCLDFCFESIRRQTYENIEIIFVNDGSLDRSGEVCKAYALKDRRVSNIDHPYVLCNKSSTVHKGPSSIPEGALKQNGVSAEGGLLRQAQDGKQSRTIALLAEARCDSLKLMTQRANCGPAAARNTGIANSKGDFILFLDADDFLEKDAVQLLLEKYYLHNADVVIGDFKKINDGCYFDSGHERVFSESSLLTKQDIINYTKNYLNKPNRFPLFAYSWGRLFKASIIKNNNIFFNVNLRTFEDVAFNFDYLCYARKVYFLNRTVYNHLLHSHYASATMAMGDDPLNLFGYFEALESIVGFLNNCNCDGDIGKAKGQACISLTIIQLVRLCGQLNRNNKRKIYNLIYQLINDPRIKNNLRYYSPSKGDSRIIPFFIKCRLVWPIIWACRHRADRRYAKKRFLNVFL